MRWRGVLVWGREGLAVSHPHASHPPTLKSVRHLKCEGVSGESTASGSVSTAVEVMPRHHTVEHDPFIKSQLSTHNNL